LKPLKEINLDVSAFNSLSTNATTKATTSPYISENIKIGKNKIKLDYGWKTLLRGMRQCLREGMEKSKMFYGRHHWPQQKLFSQTRLFIEKVFNFEDPSEYETWALVLLLNPAKGIIKGEENQSLPTSH
jgi:hypothetical protein